MKQALSSVREAIGSTPIIALDRLSAGLPHRLFGKCEFMNPGGSVKDRIGFRLVEDARTRGVLAPGGTIVEATAGNTGMGLAQAAALYGHPLVVVMTTKMSREKVNLLKAFGAEIVMCPYGVAPDSPDYFINRARALTHAIPSAWFVDQFANESNFMAHFEDTGQEIWDQAGEELDVLVGGIGTGGTLCGAGAFLKCRKPSLSIVLADPVGSIFQQMRDGRTRPEAAPYLVEGIGGDFVPRISRLDLIDEVVPVSDRRAVETAIRMFRLEGLFVGASSGCILAAALEVCARLPGRGLNVLAILPDGGRSYLSTIYDPTWRASRVLDEPTETMS